jgi:acyl-CoA synthetase (NDP forming)
VNKHTTALSKRYTRYDGLFRRIRVILARESRYHFSRQLLLGLMEQWR